jgi:hypothetical protein
MRQRIDAFFIHHFCNNCVYCLESELYIFNERNLIWKVVVGSSRHFSSRLLLAVHHLYAYVF